MNISGSVIDSVSGKPVKGVTVWSIDADGQNAKVLANLAADGLFNVSVADPNTNLNFVADGYTGVAEPAYQVAEQNSVALDPDGVVTASVSVKGIPAWIWVLLGFGFFFLIDDKKRR